MHRDTRDPFAGVIETHSGVVFFLGDRAYKLKKPVAFGFLDFTQPEVRRVVCEREVELNSRLAPDVYLGVANVLGPDGSPCEHLVVMKRLPDERRLSVLIGSNAPVEALLRQIAGVLATFHNKARRSPEIDACATAPAMLERWRANKREMEPLSGQVFDSEIMERVDSFARRYLAGREALFASRAATGRVCDGHGDLLCDDIFCLDDGPRVLDCVEFDDRLRYIDVLGDIASLAMDLQRLGRPDLGRLFLQQYGDASGDGWPDSLAHHYVAYRAQVRSMVAGLRYGQGDTESAAEARGLLSISAQHLEEGRVRLVVIGGLPGTGKSTLALEVANAIRGTRIRSDEIRKRLAGMTPTTPAPASIGEGIYSPAMTRSTYDALIEEARSHLRFGRSVVLDATFAEPSWRTAAQTLADETSADLHEFRCVAPMQLIEERLSGRASVRTASDATADVAHHMARSQRAWPTAAEVDTTRGIAETSAAVLDLMGVGIRRGPLPVGSGRRALPPETSE